MSFVLYVVVLVVSLTSVMMGLDWLSTPPPPLPKSVQTVSAPAKPATSEETAATKPAPTKPASRQTAAATGKASPTAIAKADAARQPDRTAAQPQTAGSAPPDATDDGQASASDNTLSIMGNENNGSGTTAQANAVQPRCDVQACAAHYRSFNPADCTYQPFDGPRRLCTLGTPPSQASDATTDVQTSDASQPPASSSCNYQACAAAYRSFDPATCTWQPYEGPRRLCEK